MRHASTDRHPRARIDRSFECGTASAEVPRTSRSGVVAPPHGIDIGRVSSDLWPQMRMRRVAYVERTGLVSSHFQRLSVGQDSSPRDAVSAITRSPTTGNAVATAVAAKTTMPCSTAGSSMARATSTATRCCAARGSGESRAGESPYSHPDR
jgi:hypothetical protein